MIWFILAIILLLVAAGGLLAVIFGKHSEDPSFTRGVGGVIAAVAGFVGICFLLASFYNRVDEGHVGIPVTFGEAGDPVGAGPHWLAPWTDVVTMDTRTQELTFSGDNRVTARAAGGAQLGLDVTVQWSLNEADAAHVYRTTGDMDTLRERIMVPAVRECVRDAPEGMTPEYAATEGRDEIGDLSLECVQADVAEDGVTVRDVKVRNVDPGAAVSEAIEAKTQADQDLQRREIDLAQAEVDAQIRAVEARGVNDAERIVSCGYTEEPNPRADEEGQPPVIIVPNEICEQQFSQEYLQWLLITEGINEQTIFLPHDLDVTPIIPLPDGGGE